MDVPVVNKIIGNSATQNWINFHTRVDRIYQIRLQNLLDDV